MAERLHGPSRVAVFVDSTVARGVVAKGRSASKALNAEWARWLPYTLGAGVSLGPVYIPTRMNPADGPSRLGSVPAARHSAPAFVADDDGEDLAYWTRFPKQRRDLSDWARLVIKLAWAAGAAFQVVSRGFDASLGYPGEGPWVPVAVPVNEWLSQAGERRRRVPSGTMTTASSTRRVPPGDDDDGFDFQVSFVYAPPALCGSVRYAWL